MKKSLWLIVGILFIDSVCISAPAQDREPPEGLNHDVRPRLSAKEVQLLGALLPELSVVEAFASAQESLSVRRGLNAMIHKIGLEQGEIRVDGHVGLGIIADRFRAAWDRLLTDCLEPGAMEAYRADRKKREALARGGIGAAATFLIDHHTPLTPEQRQSILEFARENPHKFDSYHIESSVVAPWFARPDLSIEEITTLLSRDQMSRLIALSAPVNSGGIIRGRDFDESSEAKAARIDELLKASQERWKIDCRSLFELELAILKTLIHLRSEQEDKLRLAARGAIEKITGRWVKSTRERLNGNQESFTARLSQDEIKTSLFREEPIWRKALNKHLDSEQLAVFREDDKSRRALRRRATMHVVLCKINEELKMTGQEMEQLLAFMERHTQNEEFEELFKEVFAMPDDTIKGEVSPALFAKFQPILARKRIEGDG